jgi:glucose-1-phosphate adenylyltransferase
MDIRQMLDFHKRMEASLTVSAIRMPLSEATEFGVIEVDQNGKMIGFEEKPQNPKPIPGSPDEALVSMGNYIFESDALCKELREDADNENSSHDFGKDIIPKMFPEGNVYVYDFSTNKISGEKETTYWRDVGTIDSYWAAHMDLLDKDPHFSLYNRKWQLHTYYPPLPPATFVDVDENKVNKVTDSLISGGSYVQGSDIYKSVLGYRSNVASGSMISESILLGDVKVGAGCKIRRAIIDKNVELAPGTIIGEDLELDAQRFHVSPEGIVVVSKGTKVGF